MKLRTRELREAAGLTKADLARCVGVDPSAVSRWESGERSPMIDKLPLLARALGCEIVDLIDQSETSA